MQKTLGIRVFSAISLLMFDDRESSMLQSGQTTGSVSIVRWVCKPTSGGPFLKGWNDHEWFVLGAWNKRDGFLQKQKIPKEQGNFKPYAWLLLGSCCPSFPISGGRLTHRRNKPELRGCDHPWNLRTHTSVTTAIILETSMWLSTSITTTRSFLSPPRRDVKILSRFGIDPVNYSAFKNFTSAHKQHFIEHLGVTPCIWWSDGK